MRNVAKVVPSTRVVEGEGFVVRRSFPTAKVEDVDPFLLLDHFGPVDFGPGEAKGAPDHPHKGFETVSYLLEGTMDHKDSQGNRGTLRAGGVQWMTAGAGIVHSEMPDAQLLRDGGRLHGFQIWVNLPRKDKLVKPGYQELSADAIPVGTSENGDVRVKVVAGEALGKKAKISTRTPILYLHYELQPGAKTEQPVPANYNALAYLISGEGSFGPTAVKAKEGDMVVFEKNGDSIQVVNTGPAALSFLLLAGSPLNEPVARYGPFVMNTRDELYEAFEEFRSGAMGTI